MIYWLDIRLKITRFFRKNKKKIIIIFIIWLIVFAVNQYLKHRVVIQLPQTTYKPHSPIMDNTDSVPEEYKGPIDEIIDSYIKYCNNKEYENAYNLLSEEFKDNYCKTLDEFSEYVDNNFQTKKIYNIQNYSNIKGTYVYRVRILEDILASGTTDNYWFDEDKFVIKKENDELKLSLGGFCGEKELNIDVEDDYMQVKIIKKNMEYDNSTYTFEIKNKTGNYIVLADSTTSEEVQLKFENEIRDATNITDADIVIYPNDSKTINIVFNEYFDDKKDPRSLIFNNIRVLPKYTNVPENTEDENNNAVKLYSLEIDLIPRDRK